MSLQPEQAEHINIVNWFNYQFPELADDFHHFANERFFDVKKNPNQWQAAKTLKRMGVKKGVADFFLAIPQQTYHGLWMELKVGKGKLSKEQKEFLIRKNDRGYLAIDVLGFEAAQKAILLYLRNYEFMRNEIAQEKLYNGKPVC